MAENPLNSFQAIRFPENGPLENVPHNAGESLFFTEYPEYHAVMGAVVDLSNSAGSNDKQRNILRRTGHNLATSPSKILNYKSSLLLIDGMCPEPLRAALTRLTAELDEYTEKQAKNLSVAPTPNETHALLDLYFQGRQNKELARKVLTGWFKSCDTPKQIVDLSYNLFVGALESENDDYEKFITQIFSYYESTKDIFAYNSNQSINFTSALLAGDDETIAKYFFVDVAVKTLQDIYPSFTGVTHTKRLEQLINSTEAKRIWDRAKEQDPARFAAMEAYYNSLTPKTIVDEDGIALTKDIVREAAFPQNLFVRQDRLKTLTRQRLERFKPPVYEEGEYFLTLILPGGEEINVKVTQETETQAAFELTREALIQRNGGEIADKDMVLKILNVLYPYNLPADFYEKLETVNKNVKDQIEDNLSASLSPRGEQVVIKDKLLNDLTISDLTYSLGEIGEETMVMVHLGKYFIPLMLDPFLNLKYQDGKAINLDKNAKLWWETVMLDYYKALVCEDESVTPLSGGQKEIKVGKKTKKREYLGRKAHRRLLGEGKGFTTEQAKKIRDSFLHIDLYHYNSNRGKTRDTGMYTFVLPEKTTDGANHKPMRVLASKATDNILELIVQTQSKKE